MRGQCQTLIININSSRIWRPYNLVLPQRAAEALRKMQEAACLSSMVIMAAGCLLSTLRILASAQLAALRGSSLFVVCTCSLHVSRLAPGIVASFDWRGPNSILPAAGKKAKSSIARHLAFIFARCVAIDLADWKLEILLDYAVETPAHPNGEHPRFAPEHVLPARVTLAVLSKSIPPGIIPDLLC